MLSIFSSFIEFILIFLCILVLVTAALFFAQDTLRRRSLKSRLSKQFPHEDIAARWERKIASPPLKISGSVWAFFWVLVIPLLLFILFPATFVISMFALLVYYFVIMLGYIIRDIYLHVQENRFIKQLPMAVDILIESLTAGQTILAGITAVGETTRAPIKNIFSEIAHRVKLGASFADVFDQMTEEHPQKPFVELGLMLALHEKTGTNIIPDLENLNKLIDEYQTQQQRIQLSSEQGRIATVFVALAPVVAIGFINVMRPQLLEPMFHAISGQVVMILCGFLLLLGIFSVYKLSSAQP